MSNLLHCEKLTKNYGSVQALKAIDLSIDSGKIIGLLGPNGSGKTTLIKLIAGLLTPTAGTLTVCGLPVGAETKAQISYLPDHIYLSDWMTVAQIIDYFKDFYADFKEERALEMLSRLGIDTAKKLKTLSKGNREKVCLILAMSRDARLYVLDEPIAGVDPAARDYVISTIIQNYNPEATVLISTHLISDIEQVLDEVIFIREGSVVLHKSLDDIRAEHGKSVDELFREVFKW